MKNNLNLIIAAALMMGFLMFWESFVMSRYNTAPPKPAPSSSTAATHEPMSPAEFKATQAMNSTLENPKTESLTILETPHSKVSFLSRGARVASWQLRERDHWIELIMPENKRQYAPLELFSQTNFLVSKLSDSEAKFKATLDNGLIVEKNIRLLSEPPFHSISIIISNPTSNPQKIETLFPLGNGIDKHEVGLPYDPKQEEAVIAETRAVGLAANIKSWKPGFIFQRTIDLVDQDSFKWFGVDSSHFLMALIPADKSAFSGIKVVADRKHPPMVALPLNTELKPNEIRRLDFKLFVGAKDYNELKKFGYQLDQSVDFGFFGVIAKMLLWTLNFFDSFTNNYGWAIVMLTFCIQLLVFPLTRKNLQHAAKMRTLQPHINKIREQYKNDPKRLQLETFNFYKKNGMKFMGMEGCFPMLLQLPVFFAFYSTLHVAYELRGAPWIFWIKDLGVHDPYYVLPIIMGAGMFLQQKLTAVAADPAQARMMMFMPVIFVFMFMKLPAGLVLYWCVNSITTIVLQALLKNKNSSDPQPIQ